MRTRMAVLLTAVMTVAATALTLTASPAGAQANQVFAGYGTGTALSINALGLGDTTVAGVHAAFSGATVDSTGLNTPLIDEFDQTVQPALPGKNAHGRGTGLEAGLVVTQPAPVDPNQLKLTDLAQASAPPPEGPITRDITLDAAPLLYAELLRGQAQAIYDPNTCAIGQPISFGRGYASNLQAIGAVNDGTLMTNTAGNNASESRTFTYFRPNGDGTFGLVSETHQHVAPISLLNDLVTIEVVGEYIMRAVATGKPGGAFIEFPGNPVLIVRIAGAEALRVELQDVLGEGGLNIQLPPDPTPVKVLGVAVGVPPHVLGQPGVFLPENADGTFGGNAEGTGVAGATDGFARIQLLNLPGLSALDLGLMHAEAAVTVPAGGIRCNIPVAKTATPNPANAGDTVTWTISIPSDPAFFSQFFACDLLNISATDTHSVLEGNPRFQITGASNGGVVSGNTVTWANLGNYRRGDPPIVVTVTGRIIGGSGVIQDTANVTATLGNCTGGVEGTIAGLTQFQNAALTGSVTLRGPDIGRGNLAATGADSRYLLLGGVLLLGAVGLRRRLRVRSSPTT